MQGQRSLGRLALEDTGDDASCHILQSLSLMLFVSLTFTYKRPHNANRLNENLKNRVNISPSQRARGTPI